MPGRMVRTATTRPAAPEIREYSLPLDTEPMEARTADKLPDNGGWQYEPKWDGFRCLAFKSGNAVELRAKSGKPLGRYFPEIVAMLAEIQATHFVLDGELVIEQHGALSFDALQMRLHPAATRIHRLSVETPARLILFDMLVGPGGKPLLEQSLDRRRALLEALVRAIGVPGCLIISPCTRDRKAASAWLETAGNGDTDGVVAKRLDQRYQPGERAMVKVKRLRTADCVVGGFRYASNRREVGSLLLGLYDAEGKLNHVGYSSTITDRERPALTRRLEALRGSPGFTGDAPGGPSRWSTERSAQWEPLRPELVVEVRFDHVTAGRFRHGTKLVRWRPDKDPAQCTYDQISSAAGHDGH
jgi:ATP-dependent DNA ligase